MRLFAAECFDLAFLVDAQGKGLLRRIEIESNDVVEFLNEVFIAAFLEGSDEMRPEVVLLPDPMDSWLAEPLGFGDAARASVGSI